MSAPIFISFSSKDGEVASAICSAVENRGYSCWISSRDIGPGENFQSQIVQAIRQAQIMLLVFSGNANNSEEIKKELVLAGQSQLVVIPVRVEDVTPDDAFAYEFATRQWVDVFGDWENAIQRVVQQIETILRAAVTGSPTRPEPGTPRMAPQPPPSFDRAASARATIPPSTPWSGPNPATTSTTLGGLPGEDDPVYVTWVMLLNGYGYNWYRVDNQLRADDILIRSRASDHLAAAAAQLRKIETRYRQKYLPPPSREHPFPDPEHLATVRQIKDITDRIVTVDTKLRGAPVPPNDMVWMRHRNEVDTLLQLGRCDVVLVGASKELADRVSALPLGSAVDDAAERLIDDHLAYISTALARRSQLLE